MGHPAGGGAAGNQHGYDCGDGNGLRARTSSRVAVSFIGEGGASLGEWHEAINLLRGASAARVFCIENNQTALSTPVVEQSAVRVFADKAVGYGIPGVTIDGTDPEAIAAAFAWAAERARGGEGPAVIELVCMRMCGHAHHDDMLYLGHEPSIDWDYTDLARVAAYADAERVRVLEQRDPISSYARQLENDGILTDADVDQLKREAEELVEAEAQAIIDAPWPEPENGRTRSIRGGTASGETRTARPVEAAFASISIRPSRPSRKGFPYSTTRDHVSRRGPAGSRRRARIRSASIHLWRGRGRSIWERVPTAPPSARAVRRSHRELTAVGSRRARRVRRSGACRVAPDRRDAVQRFRRNRVQSAREQRRQDSVPLGRISSHGGADAMGGLRHAGPYHSQNTEPWFYRTPGLKIVVPSTPQDARALMAAAVADPDPVLYYEHIALYRTTRGSSRRSMRHRLRQSRSAGLRCVEPAMIWRFFHGAYVHVAMRVAERLAVEGIDYQCSGSADALAARQAGRAERRAPLWQVLIVHEDSRTGGIGESVAAIIQEEAFESLDAPVRILGALDTPVPASPHSKNTFFHRKRFDARLDSCARAVGLAARRLC